VMDCITSTHNTSIEIDPFPPMLREGNFT